MINNSSMPYEERTLEKLKIGFKLALAEEIMLGELEPGVHFNDILRTFEIELRGFIWSEHLKKYDTSYPADWQQAFKERWFPAWAKKRWPVKYKHIQIDVRALFPNYRVPNSLGPYSIRLFEQSWTDERGIGEA